jgi:hypothetical protein
MVQCRSMVMILPDMSLILSKIDFTVFEISGTSSSQIAIIRSKLTIHGSFLVYKQYIDTQPHLFLASNHQIMTLHSRSSRGHNDDGVTSTKAKINDVNNIAVEQEEGRAKRSRLETTISC